MQPKREWASQVAEKPEGMGLHYKLSFYRAVAWRWWKGNTKANAKDEVIGGDFKGDYGLEIPLLLFSSKGVDWSIRMFRAIGLLSAWGAIRECPKKRQGLLTGKREKNAMGISFFGLHNWAAW